MKLLVVLSENRPFLRIADIMRIARENWMYCDAIIHSKRDHIYSKFMLQYQWNHDQPLLVYTNIM